MVRILFWLALLVIGILVWRKVLASEVRRRNEIRADVDRPGGELMVSCAHCGLHLPRSEALERSGQTYCSAEHARLGPPASS